MLQFCIINQFNIMSIILTSTSSVKVDAVQEIFDTVECVNVDTGVPQPLSKESGIACATRRLEYVKPENKIVIAIENFFDKNNDEWFDQAVIMIQDTNNDIKTMYSKRVYVPTEYVIAAMDQGTVTNNATLNEMSCTVTVGSIIAHKFDCDAADWHANFCPYTRKDLIKEVLFKYYYEKDIAYLKSLITYHADFPKDGILFKDCTGLLRDVQGFAQCIDLFATWYRNDKLDAIVGLESRGFIFGAALALAMGLPFVVVRKPGKLPGNTISVSYAKEYGVDTFEMSEGALTKGQQVLIIDDLIATGGSARGSIELIHKFEADVVSFASLLEVEGLGGADSLNIKCFNLVD